MGRVPADRDVHLRRGGDARQRRAVLGGFREDGHAPAGGPAVRRAGARRHRVRRLLPGGQGHRHPLRAARRPPGDRPGRLRRRLRGPGRRLDRRGAGRARRPRRRRPPPRPRPARSPRRPAKKKSKWTRKNPYRSRARGQQAAVGRRGRRRRSGTTSSTSTTADIDVRGRRRAGRGADQRPGPGRRAHRATSALDAGARRRRRARCARCWRATWRSSRRRRTCSTSSPGVPRTATWPAACTARTRPRSTAGCGARTCWICWRTARAIDAGGVPAAAAPAAAPGVLDLVEPAGRAGPGRT